MLSHRKMLPLLVVIGIIVATAIVKLQPAMQHNPITHAVTPVTTITVKKQLIRPEIKGFGEVEPDILLQVMAEVSGKVIAVHPELKQGAILEKDTIVVQIDDNDYQLALKQAQAELAVKTAEFQKLQLQIENTQMELAIAKEKLELANKELKRKQQLFDKGSLSQSVIDNEQRTVLQFKHEVQSQTGQLTTLPPQRDVVNAQIEIAKGKVATQQNNLKRTQIKLPFSARISQQTVEADQFVKAGSTLFSAQSLNKVIINAQFPFERFRIIAKGFADTDVNMETELFKQEMSQLVKELGISATISLAGNTSVSWTGNVERINSIIDPESRTLGVIVSVNDPYKKILPGIRPPLIQGMYMQVILRGKAQEFWAIPRFTQHEGELYLVNADQKLEKRKLLPVQQQGQLALYTSGFHANEQLVVSDLFPAIAGMSLEPLTDQLLQQQLLRWSKQMGE